MIGTIVHSQPESSLASVRAENGFKNVRIGDAIANLATVVSITRDRIDITNVSTGKREYIELPPFNTSELPHVERDRTEVLISRKEVDAQIANLAAILQTASVYPVMQGAQVLGFQFALIDKGSFFEKLGFHIGDRLKSVNGEAIDSLEKGLKLFNDLRDSSMIQLTIERGGKPNEITFYIR